MNEREDRNEDGPALRALNGRDRGKKWLLSDFESTNIGRGSENSITIRDNAVSKCHALVEYIDGLWFINDMGSRHGTFVNKEKVVQKKGLFHGDRIRVGESELVFEDR